MLVRHEVSATTFAQIEEERGRLMGRSELVPIYALGLHEHGPAAHDMRLDLTVATGSLPRQSRLAQPSSPSSLHEYL